MADKIRDIQSRLLKNIHGGDQVAAAIAYVPLAGWIFPYLFRKEDELCQFHGKQGLKLNIVIVAIYFVIWVIENFPLTAWLFGLDEPLHPLTRTVWLVALVAYLGASAMAAAKALTEEKWSVPYLDEVLDRIMDRIREETSRRSKGDG